MPARLACLCVARRQVKSASRLVSNKKLKELREKHDTPEGKLDKKGNPKKFCRDPPKADWTIKNDTPHYGIKESAEGGLILTMGLSWQLP